MASPPGFVKEGEPGALATGEVSGRSRSRLAQPLATLRPHIQSRNPKRQRIPAHVH
jgi:hypothetical protein